MVFQFELAVAVCACVVYTIGSRICDGEFNTE